MGLQDLIITPIYLIFFVVLAYLVRNRFTNSQTRKYFIPALLVRFFGAIMLGVIYQYYYAGGDTFNYWTHGSEWIWEAFKDDSMKGLHLLLENGGKRVISTFEYSQYIWYYRDPSSYRIVKLAALFDLLTLHTYTATALFFAVFSFSGAWAMFIGIQGKYQRSTTWLAIGILFFPSVIFWGSGILKDTITLSALGWLTYALIRIIDNKRLNLPLLCIVLVSSWLLYSIKAYILICFFPMVLLWVFWRNIIGIRRIAVKLLLVPFLISFFGVLAYLSVNVISSTNEKYSIDSIAKRAAITSYDIRYGWGARISGEGGYDLGKLDGTWSSMIALLPQAINVSLYRPYLWEVKNPLMLFSALEALIVLALTVRLFTKKNRRSLLKDPFLVFCLFFALLFAFAVGVSTYNFGTLIRYKIPMMPFYIVVLIANLQRKS